MTKTKQTLLWGLTFSVGLLVGYWGERKIVEHSENAIITMLIECEAAAGALSI